MKIVACNSNRPLAEAISAYLNLPLCKASIRRFADMECFVEIDENVRGEDVFVIQSTSFPANDNLMELLVCIDALRRGSARRITAVIPYFGYARQDRKSGPRTPISAKLVANLITQAGVDRVLTLDLHAGQIQGFFDIPVDNLFAAPVFLRDIRQSFDCKNLTMISPDVGGVLRARAIAKPLNAELAIIDKRRERAGVSEVMHIIGDVTGADCIIVDDMHGGFSKNSGGKERRCFPNFCTRFRHYARRGRDPALVIISTQRVMDLDCAVRTCATNVCLSSGIKSNKELERIMDIWADSFGGRKNFLSLWQTVQNNGPYSWLHLYLDRTPVEAYLNFETKLY